MFKIFLRKVYLAANINSGDYDFARELKDLAKKGNFTPLLVPQC